MGEDRGEDSGYANGFLPEALRSPGHSPHHHSQSGRYPSTRGTFPDSKPPWVPSGRGWGKWGASHVQRGPGHLLAPSEPQFPPAWGVNSVIPSSRLGWHGEQHHTRPWGQPLEHSQAGASHVSLALPGMGYLSTPPLLRAARAFPVHPTACPPPHPTCNPSPGVGPQGGNEGTSSCPGDGCWAGHPGTHGGN